jgi:8-oxo-dGTP pyrophosphatase MutT (NUDIX family)
MGLRSRRTARVLVFDGAGRVLLIRCVVLREDGKFVFWLTSGGEIEEGETPEQAAVRELREELVLEVPVVGPVYEEATQFEHQGEMCDNLDFYFVARCGAAAPVLRGVTVDEIAIMREIRWWRLEEVEAAMAGGVRIFPVDLVVRMLQFA